MNEWISVKDRLPDIPGDEFECRSARVLTVNCAGEIHVGGMHQYDSDEEPDWSYSHISYANDVTHWMPLPEKP